MTVRTGDMPKYLAHPATRYNAILIIKLKLNNNDTVIAGTNLSKGDDVTSFPKGSLGLGVDLSPMINAINELHTTLKATANRPAIAYINGKDPFARNLGTSRDLGTSQTQNYSYKLA